MFPVSSFLGATPATSGRTTLHFKARNGSANDDTVLCYHTGTSTKDFAVYLGGLLRKNQRNPFIYVRGADTETGDFVPSKPNVIDQVTITTVA